MYDLKEDRERLEFLVRTGCFVSAERDGFCVFNPASGVEGPKRQAWRDAIDAAEAIWEGDDEADWGDDGDQEYEVRKDLMREGS